MLVEWQKPAFTTWTNVWPRAYRSYLQVVVTFDPSVDVVPTGHSSCNPTSKLLHHSEITSRWKLIVLIIFCKLLDKPWTPRLTVLLILCFLCSSRSRLHMHSSLIYSPSLPQYGVYGSHCIYLPVPLSANMTILSYTPSAGHSNISASIPHSVWGQGVEPKQMAAEGRATHGHIWRTLTGQLLSSTAKAR